MLVADGESDMRWYASGLQRLDMGLTQKTGVSLLAGSYVGWACITALQVLDYCVQAYTRHTR